jgi:hypothetical protein
MAELATIARPYAEALFQASRADLSGTAQWLDALAMELPMLCRERSEPGDSLQVRVLEVDSLADLLRLEAQPLLRGQAASPAARAPRG